MNYIAQAGDLFLTDSNKIGARIVKFMQTSPTLWQWLRGIRYSVNYFHAGMIINSYRLIEQQNKVGYCDSVSKILTKKIKIFRCKTLTNDLALRLMFAASRDVGKGYDILLILGKTLTWLTGLKFFTRYIESKEKEICVSRVCRWYKEVVGEAFGVRTIEEITTLVIDTYCSSNSNWEVVYEN